MNLDLNLPLNTRLHDLNFAIQYRLLDNNDLHSKKHSDAIAINVLSITERARKQKAANELHDSVYCYYHDHLSSLAASVSKRAKGGLPVQSLSKTIDGYLANYDRYEKFMKVVRYSPILHNLALSYMPLFFEKNGIDGFEAELAKNSFDEISPSQSTFWFCAADIKANCMSAGYLRGAITVRAAVPKGDTKLLNALRDNFRNLRLNTSKPVRLKLENNMLVYELKVLPTEQDLNILQAANKGLEKYREAYKQNAGSRAKYVLYADEEPLSDVGFANLKEVQAFLDIVNVNLVAIQDGDKPEVMYYNNFMHLISIHDKNGAMDISRFKFPAFKPA